jgi:hypothetical protein
MTFCDVCAQELLSNSVIIYDSPWGPEQLVCISHWSISQDLIDIYLITRIFCEATIVENWDGFVDGHFTGGKTIEVRSEQIKIFLTKKPAFFHYLLPIKYRMLDQIVARNHDRKRKH